MTPPMPSEIRFLILAATRPPGQRPAAHGVLDVIPAAARDEHGTVQAQQPLENFHHDVVGHAQMRQRIAGQNVQAEFQHDHVGA